MYHERSTRLTVAVMACTVAWSIETAAADDLIGYRAEYDMVIEFGGEIAERGTGVLTITFQPGCTVDTTELVLDTVSPEGDDGERRSHVVRTEEEARDGSSYTMRTVSEMSRLAEPGGAVVEADSATIEATATPHPDGTLEVVDHSFDVARTETFPLSPGTLFPNAALRRQIAGAAAGEVAFGFPTLRADRRQAVRAQVEVLEPIVEAAATTVTGPGANLLRRPGWRFLIVRRNLSGDEVGRETAVVLDNGVVVDSVYTSGRLRSATTLRTIEPLSMAVCEDVAEQDGAEEEEAEAEGTE